MSISYCPHCNQEFSYNPISDTDYVHDCNSGNELLDNEDLIALDRNNAFNQGITNSLWGTRAAHDGEKNFDRTSRGNQTEIVKTRPHQEFIVLKEVS